MDLDALRPRIQAILASANLDTVSAKQVRKRLCAEEPRLDEQQVKRAKQAIDEVISDLFAELRPSLASPPPAPSRPSPTGRSVDLPSGGRLPSPSPPPSSLPLPLASTSTSTSHLHKPSKQPKPPKPPKKERERDGDADALLAQRLSDELNAHSTRASGGASGAGSRPSASSKAKVKAKGKRPAKANGSSTGTKRRFKSDDVVDSADDSAVSRSPSSSVSSESGSDDDEAGKPRRKKVKTAAVVAGRGARGRGRGGGAFNKEMGLSPELARLVGGSQMSRPQSVKRIWDYVKARDLQDPADKRYIVCEGDALLTAVFKTARVHMFTMNKVLSKHLFPLEE